MPVPQTIQDLVERFERNLPAYRSGSYNETQLRREFLDPFFESLAVNCRFALDREGFVGTNTTYFIPGDDLYLLGILNSKWGNFYFSEACVGLEGGCTTYLRFFGQYLDAFPVRPIDPADITRHEQMVALVEQMLDLHKKLAEASIPADRRLYERQIETTDRQIDALVYELYGLSDEEIRIVEGEE
jgi:hypothetical protein